MVLAGLNGRLRHKSIHWNHAGLKHCAVTWFHGAVWALTVVETYVWVHGTTKA